MKLQLTDKMTFAGMTELLGSKLPYETTLKKNPLLRFEYIQVRKAPFVGVWIRVFPKKNNIQLIKAIPDTWARALFGGLLVLLFFNGAQNKVRDEIAEILKGEYDVDKV